MSKRAVCKRWPCLRFKGDGLLEANGPLQTGRSLARRLPLLKSALGDPQRGGNADPAAVQGRHRDFKALALFA